MKTSKTIFAILVSAIPALLLCCGGTSETGNSRAIITGSVADGGTAISDAKVRLVAETYVPGGDSADEVFSTTTDRNGNYRFEEVPGGIYYLNARKAAKRYLSGPVEVMEGENALPTATLAKMTQVSITLPESTAVAFVFVKGTGEAWSVTSGTLLLDSIPAGTITVVGVKSSGSTGTLTEENSVSMTIEVQPESKTVASFGNKPPQFLLPVTSGSSTCVVKNQTYTSTVAAVDPENGVVRYRLAAGPQGMKIDSVTGVITWQTGASVAMVASGTYTYSVKATDAGGASQTASFSVTVAEGSFVLVPGKTDSSTGIQGGLYLVRIDTLTAGVNAFRLSWGDGDSTGWLKTPEAVHQWTKSGSYRVSYQMQYSDGSFSTWHIVISTIIISGSVITVDTTPPVITVVPDTIMVLDSISIDYYHRFFPKNYRAFDLVDGDLTAKVSVTTYPVAPGDSSMGYTNYAVRDAAGNNADTVLQWIFLPPSFSIPTEINLSGFNSMGIRVGEPWVEPGFKAVDMSEGDITNRVEVDSSDLVANLSKPGTYHVFYSVPIGETIVVIRQRTVTVVDNIEWWPPVIILKGNNPDTVAMWSDSVYKDPGYTAMGSNNEDLTGNVVRLGMVDIYKVGTYTLSYSVRDAAGNSGKAIRTVVVINTTIIEPGFPEITLAGNSPDTINLWENPDDTVYHEPGYHAVDEKDGDITSKVVVTGTVDINVPGIDTLTYFVRDADSNTTMVKRSVEVLTWARYPETLIKYEVPTGMPLPDRATVYRTGESNGIGGPELATLTSMQFSWVSGANRLTIILERTLDPGTVTDTLTISRQLLGTSECALLVQESGIEGLDGPYYVRVDGSTMYWVAFERDLVIAWKE